VEESAAPSIPLDTEEEQPFIDFQQAAITP
jgi:hypothetical protein